MLYEVITNDFLFMSSGEWNRKILYTSQTSIVDFMAENIDYSNSDIDNKQEMSIDLTFNHSKFVITSYSIHYTKLYDQITSGLVIVCDAFKALM